MSKAFTLPEICHARVPGRLRLAVPEIRDRPKKAAALAAVLCACPGIHRADARSVTGSVILKTDPAIPVNQLRATVARALSEKLNAAAARQPPPEAKRSRGGSQAPGEREAAWHAVDKEQLLSSLGTSPATGLSPEEAERRLRRHGPNLMPHEAGETQLQMLLKQFEGLPVAMLARPPLPEGVARAETLEQAMAWLEAL